MAPVAEADTGGDDRQVDAQHLGQHLDVDADLNAVALATWRGDTQRVDAVEGHRGEAFDRLGERDEGAIARRAIVRGGAISIAFAGST